MRELTNKQIDALDNVQEHLILPIPDALRSPRNSIGHGNRWPDDFQFMRFLGDVSERETSVIVIGLRDIPTHS